MYPKREIFPHSPLALVAAEARYTDAILLKDQAALDRIALALSKKFPYPRSLAEGAPRIQVTTGNGQIQASAQVGVALVDAEGTSSLTVTPNALIYETTAYRDFPHLVDAMQVGCAALAAEGIRTAVQRVGLRYVDEIRVPEQITDIAQWAEWVDPRLVQQADIGPRSAPAQTTQGVTVYEIGERQGLIFRHAALNQSPVVVPQVLQHPQHEAGPFFVLDFDAFQDFTVGTPLPLEADAITASLNAVHAPAGEAFQNAITDRARELFRGERS